MRLRRAVAVMLVAAAVLVPAAPARADTVHFLCQFESVYSGKCLDLAQWTDDDGLPPRSPRSTPARY